MPNTSPPSETDSLPREKGQKPQASSQELRYDIPCLICGQVDHSVMIDDPPFKIVRCPSCRFVYTVPRLPSTMIEDMYQEDYWQSQEAKSFGYTDYLKDKDLYLRTYRMRSAVIDKYKKTPGHILDVGSAAGFFLKAMDEKGWKTTGVELSAFVSEYARREMGLKDIRTGSLLDQDLPEGHFDVITMWDVIEHLEDPRPIVSRIHSLLADDGILVLETQNVESRFAKVMGKSWTHYKYEEHLYHFSPQTLTRFMGELGFEPKEISPRRGGKYVSLGFIVERVGKIHPVFSVLLKPLNLMKNMNLYVNPFDEMIAVFRKAR